MGFIIEIFYVVFGGIGYIWWIIVIWFGFCIMEKLL